MNKNLIFEIIQASKEYPVFFLVRLSSFFYRFFLSVRPTVMVGEKLCLKGWPVIETLGHGQVTIGNNVTLYSTRRQYFAALCGPVRLFAEEHGKIIIGDNTRINGTTIHARSHISIGKNCLIAANTSIIDSHGHKLCLENPAQRIHSIDSPQRIDIGDNVWIGMNCLILKGVDIGSGAVIGANNVVSKSVAPNTLLRSPGDH